MTRPPTPFSLLRSVTPTTGSTLFLSALVILFVAIIAIRIDRIRNLITERNASSKQSIQALNKQDAGYNENLKIFLYDIPNHLLFPPQNHLFNCDKQDMYYTERLFPEILRQSHFVIDERNLLLSSKTTKDIESEINASPSTTTYFLIPQYSTCFYHHCVFHQNLTTDTCKSQTSNYINTIIQHIRNQYNFWNTSHGTDHIFIFPWDQASEILGWESDTRALIKPAIHLTSLGSVAVHPNFDPHKDIVIPTFNKDLSDAIATLKSLQKTSNPKFTNMTHDLTTRQTFAYFRGTFISDRRYSRGVRQYLQKLGNLYPERYSIHQFHSPSYWSEISDAVFCLCPEGWSPWSPRLFDCMGVASIPVIFADGTELPFEDSIPYREFAVKIHNENHEQLDNILRRVVSNRTDVLRRFEVMKLVREMVVWNLPYKKNDAFDLVMRGLWRKRRSRRIGNWEFA